MLRNLHRRRGRPARRRPPRRAKPRRDGLRTVARAAAPDPAAEDEAAPARRDRDREPDRDDYEEEPEDRRRGRRQKSGSILPLLLLIGGGVLLLLLMGGGVIMYLGYTYGHWFGSAVVDSVPADGGDGDGGFFQPGPAPVAGQDIPADADDAVKWIHTAKTAERQNQAMEYLASATVIPAKQKEVAKALETMVPSGNTHDAAVHALTQWGGTEDIPTLLRAADEDKYWGFGGPADTPADALVRLKADGAAVVFARHLPTAHAAARQKLADLCATGDAGLIRDVEREALRHFDDPNNEARTDAVELLRGACGTKPETLLDQALVDLRNREPGYARWACDYLSRQPVDAARQAQVAKALETAMSDPNGETRKAAATALGTWGTKDNVPALIAEMDRKDGNTFEPCVTALTRLADEKVAVAVAAHLPDWGNNREAVGRALLAMGPVAQKAVASYITHPDKGVRDEAERLAKALNVGDDVNFAARIADLTAKEGEQRKAACDFLAAHPPDPTKDAARQKEVARALDKLLTDEDNFFHNVPDAAAKALAVWGDKDSVPALIAAMQKPNSQLLAVLRGRDGQAQGRAGRLPAHPARGEQGFLPQGRGAQGLERHGAAGGNRPGQQR